MKKITILSVILLMQGVFSQKILTQCAPGISVDIMDYNNVKSYHSTKGVLWQDISTANAGYEIPKGSGLKTLYSGGIWVAGTDGNGVIHLAAETYGAGGNEFWPGPIEESTGNAYSCLNYDRFWTVTKAEIDAFLFDGTTSVNILEWPGKNNPNLSFIVPNQNLAPFVDANSDGDYNPLDGDYPAIKGDMNKWWVMNDVGNVHTATGALALGIELHFMSYTFATNDAINNSVFYDVEILNKSDTMYSGTHFGLFVDPDIGGYADDYIGCDTSRNLGYAYNGDNTDSDYGTFPPVQGIAMVDLPILDGQIASMSSFAGFSSGGNPAMNDPVLPIDYYNYLQGYWKDGSPMVYGGNGHTSGGGTQPFPYQYAGLPSDGAQWSECSESNIPGDRRFVISFGEFNFIMGRKITMSFATVYHRPTSGSNCESIDDFLSVVDSVQGFYDTIPSYFTGSVGVLENELIEVNTLPNPARNFITIDSKTGIKSIDIFNSIGAIVKGYNKNDKTIDVSSLSEGVYIINIEFEDLTRATRKVIISR